MCTLYKRWEARKAHNVESNLVNTDCEKSKNHCTLSSMFVYRPSRKGHKYIGPFESAFVMIEHFRMIKYHAFIGDNFVARLIPRGKPRNCTKKCL